MGTLKMYQLFTLYDFMCSWSSRFVRVVIDLDPADQFSDQLLHSVRAQSSHLQDAVVVHTLRVLIALHHLTPISSLE